jgi:uncharacterized protein (TIGR01619 family)
MSEDWDSYFCNVNGKFASSFVDLGIRSEAPDRSKPWLAWIWVYMKHSREDGLFEVDELDGAALLAVQADLEDKLPAMLDGVFVGRITTDGHKEFYYYVSATEQIEATIAGFMNSFPAFRFDSETQEDPEWSQYLDVLFPSEEQMQKIQNRRVLEVLEKEGDRLTEPREIDHWIYFRTEKDRKEYRDAVTPLGFRVVGEYEPEAKNEEFPFGLQVARTDRVDQDSIDDVTLELFRFSKLFKGNYDGWEAPIIKEGDSKG